MAAHKQPFSCPNEPGALLRRSFALIPGDSSTVTIALCVTVVARVGGHGRVHDIPLRPSALLSSSSEITSAASPAVILSGIGIPHLVSKAVSFGWLLAGACRQRAWGFTSPPAPVLRARSSASPWA